MESTNLAQRRRISPSSSEMAVPRIWSVNPTRLTCRNELHSDGLCLDGAFVSDNVHVGTTGIDKPHPCCVHMGLALGIVPLIGRYRYRSRRDGDQAMARVRVPAGATSWLPDVALYEQI